MLNADQLILISEARYISKILMIIAISYWPFNQVSFFEFISFPHCLFQINFSILNNFSKVEYRATVAWYSTIFWLSNNWMNRTELNYTDQNYDFQKVWKVTESLKARHIYNLKMILVSSINQSCLGLVSNKFLFIPCEVFIFNF